MNLLWVLRSKYRIQNGVIVCVLLLALTVTARCKDPHTEKHWPANLRGLDVEGPLDEAYFRKLKGWNINLLRVHLGVDADSQWSGPPGKALPPIPQDDPTKPYAKSLAQFELILSLAQKFHVYVIPSLDNFVGRSNDVMLQRGDDPAVYSDKNIDAFWVTVARKYGHNRYLLAYDLLNEPNGPAGKLWVSEVEPGVISQIRKIDKNTFIVHEPAPWALPDQAFQDLKPIHDPKVVYSFHFYYPHPYTHQGILDYAGPNYRNKYYPGMLRFWANSPTEDFWNKAHLEKIVAAVVKFQESYHVNIYVGEFGVLRWAPGGDRWLEDVISIFEQHAWNWTYHSYGGWNGWNPTFNAGDAESDKRDGGALTPNLKVLLSFWRKNSQLTQRVGD